MSDVLILAICEISHHAESKTPNPSMTKHTFSSSDKVAMILTAQLNKEGKSLCVKGVCKIPNIVATIVVVKSFRNLCIRKQFFFLKVAKFNQGFSSVQLRESENQLEFG